MKKSLIGVLAVIIVLAAAGAYYLLNKNSVFNLSGKQNKTIKIVASFPMRGMGGVTASQSIVNAIKLAFNEANYTAGKYKIELVVEDDGDETGAWDGATEEAIARKAAADPNVVAYLGTYNSGAAKKSIPITNQAGLVQISPANTWPGLTQPGFAEGEPGIFYPTGVRNYFRVCPTDASQGPAGAIWAKELGAKNVYILDDGESYGKGIADFFAKKAAEIGLNVVGRETLDKKAAAFPAEIAELKAKSADFVYFGGVTSNGAISLIKDIRRAGLTAKFMGPDGIMDQAFIDGASGAAEGAYVTVVSLPGKELTTESGKRFYKNYIAAYGAEPESMATFGYELGKVVLTAIARAGTADRQNILKEVAATKNYDGILGKWSFDANGDTTMKVVSGNTVSGNAYAFVKILPVQ